MNYLLIVEGEKAEPKLFETVFSRYGFKIEKHPRPKTFNDDIIDQFSETLIGNDKNVIHIMQAPNNCIEGFLHQAIREKWDLAKAFGKDTDFFAGKFIVFDVDHAPNEELKSMMDIYCDETDQGLLIISSPCLEIISEPERKDPIKVTHLKEYKKQRNIYLDNNVMVRKNAMDYIIENFETLISIFLESNTVLFSEENTMEHPRLAVEEVNKRNIRQKSGVCYTYFTSVIYVIVGYVMGLTKQINNSESIKEFLLTHKKQQVLFNNERLCMKSSETR